MFSVLLFLALSSISTARPGLHRRGLPGAVYTCTEPNFSGKCQWNSPTTICRQPGPASLHMGLESLGPDPGTTCILYEKFDCTGNEVKTVRFPGIPINMPEFQAFKCTPDSSTQGNKPQPTNTTLPSSVKALDPHADPRLAGGIGSLHRKNHLDEIKAMEANGFKEGMIGLEKGVYY